MLGRHRGESLKLSAAAAVLVFATGTASCPSHRPPLAPSTAVAALHDASLREEAVCSLLRRGEYAVSKPRYTEKVPSGGCKVRSLFDETPRPGGTFVVVMQPDWEDPELPARPDAGALVIFDRTGKIVPVFEAANYLGKADGVIRYRADGAVAVVHQFPYGGDPEWSVEVLHVVPGTIDQQPILSLLLGLSRAGLTFPTPPRLSWRARDVDHDGNIEFEIGPASLDGSIDVKATYRYSPQAHRYEGPAGSLAGDFYLIPRHEGSIWAVAADFVRAHGITVTSKGGCDPCR